MNKAQAMRQKALEMVTDAKNIYGLEDASDEQVTRADELIEEAKTINSRADRLEAAEATEKALRQPQMPADLPAPGSSVENDNQAKAQADAADRKAAVAKSIHTLRFGDIDSNVDAIGREIYGDDYRKLAYEQAKAFNQFMRFGTDHKILHRQVWSIEDVKAMLKDDMSVEQVKSTMVEGQDVLGGYAVPPEMGAQILARAAGLTAVRAAGATVIQTSSKSIEWLKLTTTGSLYSSALRGSWGTETQNPPAETNMTFGLEQIPVHVYTYKTPFSTSLLEDASNLSQMFIGRVAETLGIDEDAAFLTGTGVGRPRGLLPDSLNGHSLSEVVSTSAAALTWTGLKNLRRGVASQYRAAGRASWIAESATGGAIEALTDGDTRNYIDALTPGQDVQTLGGRWLESESMPTIAANAFPVLYGDFSGYFIVERLGLAVQRYNDSNTGINNVEFHIRRRIGGDVMEPWKMAVQKCST